LVDSGLTRGDSGAGGPVQVPEDPTTCHIIDPEAVLWTD